jgi:hypothetical protein
MGLIPYKYKSKQNTVNRIVRNVIETHSIVSEMKLAGGQTDGVVFFVYAYTLSSKTSCLEPTKSVISVVVWIISSLTTLCHGVFQGTLAAFSAKF